MKNVLLFTLLILTALTLTGVSAILCIEFKRQADETAVYRAIFDNIANPKGLGL
jgi:hypothetical protein